MTKPHPMLRPTPFSSAAHNSAVPFPQGISSTSPPCARSSRSLALVTWSFSPPLVAGLYPFLLQLPQPQPQLLSLPPASRASPRRKEVTPAREGAMERSQGKAGSGESWCCSARDETHHPKASEPATAAAATIEKVHFACKAIEPYGVEQRYM